MADLQELKEAVCAANLELVKRGLVILTWGNVSGVDRDAGVMVIKPSGIDYDSMTPDRMVVVRLEDGKTVGGKLNPSSDTPTHLQLYREFPLIGGICHTHSTYATAFAQALTPLPALGTTHADAFYGAVPVTRPLRPEEINVDYEKNTGRVIAELWHHAPDRVLDIPAVLVSGHGPFTWGKTAAASVEIAQILEETAKMALATLTLNPNVKFDPHLLDKHFLRKHGPGAYYGQRDRAK